MVNYVYSYIMSQNTKILITRFINKKQVIYFFDIVLKFYGFMFSWNLYNRIDKDDKYIIIVFILLAFLNKKLKKIHVAK